MITRLDPPDNGPSQGVRLSELGPFEAAMLDVTICDAASQPCILCGGTPSDVGLHKPPGEPVLVVYAICSRCTRSRDWRNRVEALPGACVRVHVASAAR